jgi:hypothetical protein
MTIWRGSPVAVCLLVFVAGGAAFAQDTQPFRLTDYEFLERQYILWSPERIVTNGEVHRLGFEGQVGPHVPLVGGPLDRRDPADGTHWEWRLIFTFQTYLRMTTADSAPVVTPSYMPRFRLQFLGNHVVTAADTENPTRSWRWGATIDLWSHHSNGQDGCTFQGTTAPGKACPEIGASATALNERNGSFGTDYTGATLNGRYSWGVRPHSRALSLLGGLGGSYHHNFPGGGLGDSPDGDLTKLWGRLHGSVEGEARWNVWNEERSWAGDLFGRYRLDLASGGSDPRLPGVTARHDRHTMEVGWICTRLFGLGAFVRVVTGREYYNIEFTQAPTRVQFGIVIDTAGNVPAIGVKPMGGGPTP